jgi:hypothetical protein
MREDAGEPAIEYLVALAGVGTARPGAVSPWAPVAFSPHCSPIPARTLGRDPAGSP